MHSNDKAPLRRIKGNIDHLVSLQSNNSQTGSKQRHPPPGGNFGLSQRYNSCPLSCPTAEHASPSPPSRPPFNAPRGPGTLSYLRLFSGLAGTQQAACVLNSLPASLASWSTRPFPADRVPQEVWVIPPLSVYNFAQDIRVGPRANSNNRDLFGRNVIIFKWRQMIYLNLLIAHDTS